MNYDENFWRALAVIAQELAAREYHFARHYDGHLGRVFQRVAYQTHQIAMVRLGLAAEDRSMIDHSTGGTSYDH